MDNLDIVNKAVAALNRKLPTRHPATVDIVEDTAYINVMGRRFWCLVRPTLTTATFLTKMPPSPSTCHKNARLIYVTTKTNDAILDVCLNVGQSIMDIAGNFVIQYPGKNEELLLMLSNRGEAPVEDNQPQRYPIFKESGLKVIFFFLLDRNNINLPFRKITEATGVSMGTVKNIIDGMVYQQLARVEGRRRILINTERLLMLWANNYSLNLKPKLLVAHMRFRNDDFHRNWKDIELPAGMMWGGEPAANLTDGFLTPGKFDIYSRVPASYLLKTGTMLPDSEGRISVYKQFWSESVNGHVVPSILIYADLIESGDSRCAEAAQKIKDNELEYLF